jgi:transcriptional regulator with XRE-family HTH domain
MGSGVPISGYRLSEARKAMMSVNGTPVSQATAAALAGVHWMTWSNWERGQSSPSWENVQRIVQVTGVPLEYLLGTDDEKVPA